MLKIRTSKKVLENLETLQLASVKSDDQTMLKEDLPSKYFEGITIK